MHRNNKINLPGVIIVLLMLLLVAVALAVVVRSCGAGKDIELSPSPVVPGSVTTDVGGTTAAPGGTSGTLVPGASSTARPVPTPSPTPTPVPTPTPTPAPTAVVASSGSFSSNETNGLNISVSWLVSDAGNNNVKVTVDLSAVSYSLYCSAIWHGGEVTIGGQTYAFDTKAISYAGPGLATNSLGTHSFTIPSTSLGMATVKWNFRGTYSGVEVPAVTASGTIG